MFRKSIWAIGIGMVACVGSAFAREEPAPTKYMKEAVGNVAGIVLKVNAIGTLGYDDGISLLGGFVRRGQTLGLTHELRSGVEYAFLTGGDSDVLDLDMEISDEFGNLAAFDRGPGEYAVVRFTPGRAARYTIRIKLESCRAKNSFCALAILRDGGWNAPENNVVKALGDTLEMCERIVSLGRSVRFLNEPNQWSLFGGVQRSGSSMKLSNMHLGTARHLIVGAGDVHAQDIDAYLRVPGFNALIAKDDQPDPRPVIDVVTIERNDYELELKNEKSDGPSLMFVAALEQR